MLDEIGLLGQQVRHAFDRLATQLVSHFLTDKSEVMVVECPDVFALCMPLLKL